MADQSQEPWDAAPNLFAGLFEEAEQALGSSSTAHGLNFDSQ